MKWLVPKQHGAWAMLMLPFALGIAAGQPSWLHLPLFIGWLLLYFATYPLLMAVKGKNKRYYLKWLAIYMSMAAVTLVIPLHSVWQFMFFGLAMLPFLAVNAYFAKMNKERALLNDFCA